MNSKQTNTLRTIFSNPVNGNLEWSRIESLFVAIGCRVVEKEESGVMFEKDDGVAKSPTSGVAAVFKDLELLYVGHRS
ncbi:MAG: hypothetical protein QM483_14190 [Desulfuromusa sp.]